MEKREDQQNIDCESEDDADQKDFNDFRLDTIASQQTYNLKSMKVLNLFCCCTNRNHYETGEVLLGKMNSFQQKVNLGSNNKEILDLWVLLPDGSKYNGEWLNAKCHGQGTCVYPDGSSYVGEWENGKPHGQGKQTKKGITYEGQFFNGLAHGQGEMRYSEGAYYNGAWKDGVKHGQNCTERWDDGVIYYGDFENDYMHGKGLIKLL